MKKTVKRLTTIVLCVMLMMTSTCIMSSAESFEASLDDILQKDIATIYKNIDLGESKDLLSDASEEVLSFLEAKKEAWQYVYSLNHIQKNNYKVSAKLISESQVGDCKLFLYGVETKFNYGESAAVSGEGFELLVKYDLTKNMIVDVYEPLDAFDMEVREEDSPPLFSENLVKAAKSMRAIPSKTEIQSKCSAFKKDVSKQKKIDEQTVIYKDTEKTPAVKTAGSSIYTAIKFGQEVIVNNV